MKKLFVLILSISIVGISTNAIHSAPYWVRTYEVNITGGAHSVQQTNDGGYILAGESSSCYDDLDIFVLKLDPYGIVSWHKTYGREEHQTSPSIRQTVDGGYILLATSFRRVWILKLDESGNIIWQKTYREGPASLLSTGRKSIQQTTDGGYIVLGQTEVGYEDNLWIIKLDDNGNVTWGKYYDAYQVENGTSIQQISDGGYIVSGWAHPTTPGYRDLWMLRLDEDGNVFWSKTYGEEFIPEFAESVIQTFDGGFIAVGGTYPNKHKLDRRSAYRRVHPWFIKVDESGNIIWQKTYKFMLSFLSYPQSIQHAPSGGYIVLGYDRFTNEFSNFISNGFLPYLITDCAMSMWILKLGENGDIIWHNKFSKNGCAIARSIQPAIDGGYILAGETEVPFYQCKNDVLVLKLNDKGDIPDCHIVKKGTIISSNTHVTAQSTPLSVGPASVSVTDTTITAKDSSTEINTICHWTEQIFSFDN